LNDIFAKKGTGDRGSKDELVSSRMENSKMTHSDFGDESNLNESGRNDDESQANGENNPNSLVHNTGRTYDDANVKVVFEGFGDGLLYFLTAYDLSNKQNIIELPTILDKWGEQDPLSYISLFSPRIFNTFLQLFLINKLSFYSDDMLEALIPLFVYFLYFPTNVISPLSEFLVEKACQNPMTFG
jgi:hypothetical protein